MLSWFVYCPDLYTTKFFNMCCRYHQPMKVINWQSLSKQPVLNGGSTPTYSQNSEYIRLHTSTSQHAYVIKCLTIIIGNFRWPMNNVYLWDQASHESHNRFNESLATLAVVLVTAVNTKRIGGKTFPCLNQ